MVLENRLGQREEYRREDERVQFNDQVFQRLTVRIAGKPLETYEAER